MVRSLEYVILELHRLSEQKQVITGELSKHMLLSP